MNCQPLARRGVRWTEVFGRNWLAHVGPQSIPGGFDTMRPYPSIVTVSHGAVGTTQSIWTSPATQPWRDGSGRLMVITAPRPRTNSVDHVSLPLRIMFVDRTLMSTASGRLKRSLSVLLCSGQSPLE